MDAWLTITADATNQASADFVPSSPNLGAGVLHNFARRLEQYAEGDGGLVLARGPFRERFKDVGVPDDGVPFAVVTLEGDQVDLFHRPPELSAFHAVSVAGILRTQAMLPILAGMTMQVVMQVMNQLMAAQAQAQQDQRLRELIARGAGTPT